MRVRQHVNPLKSNFFVIKPDAVKVPVGAALEVELGSAEAYYLMDRARHEPAGYYVGIEIRRELVDKANGYCREQRLQNVSSVYANINVDLRRLFGQGQVRRFFLNFPDPCFKTKQHKRRVMGPQLVEDMHWLLADNGEVFVNTDIFDLALEAMLELEWEAPRRFENQESPWTFLKGPRFAARSRRETECEGKGVKIWRLAYRRVSL